MGEGQEEFTYTGSVPQKDLIMEEVVSKAQEVYLNMYDVKHVNGFYVVKSKETGKVVKRTKTYTKYEEFQTNEIMEIVNTYRRGV